jgi:hypothetical protein
VLLRRRERGIAGDGVARLQLPALELRRRLGRHATLGERRHFSESR